LAGLALVGSLRCSLASPWHAWHMLPWASFFAPWALMAGRCPLVFVASRADGGVGCELRRDGRLRRGTERPEARHPREHARSIRKSHRTLPAEAVGVP
jgi:hypothetical protein